MELEAYQAQALPESVKQEQHLIAIGTQDTWPLEDAFEGQGLQLGRAFSRQWQQNQIQTLPDGEGLVQQQRSPWNQQRMVLALSGQTAAGLDSVRQLFKQDSLFYQLQGDTVLVSAPLRAAEPSDLNSPADYSLTVLKKQSRSEPP
ncbi:MAG: hypothetical protein HC886_17520 [Leptolyngbyaceae cyanobacterium SM1_1_3]|nr:hypothetical protein [Leptolyngbyaceae cyanobacterium SM1_1_3]